MLTFAPPLVTFISWRVAHSRNDPGYFQIGCGLVTAFCLAVIAAVLVIDR